MSEEHRVHLIETTLRDGSYEVDFQFTKDDTAVLASGLDAAGFRYIEVGHGMGAGSELWAPEIRAKIKRSAAGDSAYMSIAREVVKRAQLGVIVTLGEGLTPIEYLDELPLRRMSFVRLAIWPNEERARTLRFVERAKALGLLVSINVMQSYALSPAKLASLAADAGKHGADWFYIVDSAGGMQPHEVEEYVRALRDSSSVEVGLHAHNNLGLALANSLAAIKAGATLVDATLNGVGRATGNPPTEQLLFALQARGHETNVDVEAVSRLGSLARTLYAERGQDPLHFASGAAMLHSRNVPALVDAAKKRGRVRSEFLLRAGEEARKTGMLAELVYPERILEVATEQSSPDRAPVPSEELVRRLGEELLSRSRGSLPELCEHLAIDAKKHKKTSVLHLVPLVAYPHAANQAWQSERLTGASIPVGDDALEIIPPALLPDVVLIDGALKDRSDLPAAKRARIACSHSALLLEATLSRICALHAESGGTVWLAVGNGLQQQLSSALDAMGVPRSNNAPARPRVIVGGVDGRAWVDQVQSGERVILVGKTSVARPVVDALRARGATAVAPILSMAAAARVTAVLSVMEAGESAKSGAVSWSGPGAAPATGDVLVDDAAAPSFVVDRGARNLEEVASALARHRAITLLSGKGSL